MDEPGHEVLAGAGLAGDEHGRLAARRLQDEPGHVLHERRREDEIPGAEPVIEPFLEEGDLPAQLLALRGPLEDEEESFEIDGLDDVVVGPRADGFDGPLDIAVSRDHDRRHQGIRGEHVPDGRRPGVVAELVVDDGHVDGMAQDRLQGLFAGSGLDHREAVRLQVLPDELALDRIVLDDQDEGLVHVTLLGGRRGIRRPRRPGCGPRSSLRGPR